MVAPLPPLADAPIYQLPSEILLEIFAHAIWSVIPMSALAISHVCHLWRQLIIQCPYHWSRMCLRVDTRAPHLLAKRWLRLSADLPLFIEIDFEPTWRNVPATSRSDAFVVLREPDDIEDETEGEGESLEGEGEKVRDHRSMATRFALALKGSMGRWQEFSIRAKQAALSDFFRVCSGCTPNLKRLSASTDDEGGRFWTPSIQFELPPDSASTSIDVSFGNRVFSIPGPLFGNAVRNLSIDILLLDSRYDVTEPLFAALAACPNLVGLSVRQKFGSSGSSPQPRLPVTLQSLTSISIISVPEIGDILGLLQLPSLQSLQLHNFTWGHSMTTALEDLFNHCRSLSIVDLIGHALGNEANLLELVSSVDIILTQIKELRITGDAHIAARFLTRLVLPSVEVLCLEDVELELAFRLTNTSHHLTSFTLHRARAAAPNTATTTSRVSFPSLKSLETLNSSNFINHIHAPDLKSLVVKTENEESLGPCLLSFFDDSNPPLLTLNMDTVRMSPRHFVACFKKLPSVETLGLQNTNVSDIVLEELSMVPRRVAIEGAKAPEPIEQGCLLPRLREIYWLYNHFRSPALATFLESRNAALAAEICRVSGASRVPHRRIEGKVGFIRGRHVEGNDEEVIKSFGIHIVRPIII